MYIAKGLLSKRKWIYTVLISLFFLLVGLNFLIMEAAKIDYKQMIAQSGGELPFLAMMLMQFAFFLIILILIVKLVHKQRFIDFTTARKSIDYKRFFFAFGVWSLFTIVSVFINYLIEPESFVWNFQMKKFIQLTLILFLLVPFQAGFEEYFFRGYLLQGLGTICKRKWFPLLFTSITFGLMHLGNPEIEKMGYGFVSMYILLGLSFGIMTLMDDGLELALGVHISNNIFSGLLVTSEWTAFQTPSLFKLVGDESFDFFTGISIMLPTIILLFIFAKKYKWNNWKEKLFGRIILQKEIE